MKFVGVFFGLLACICSTAGYPEAKPGVLLEALRNRYIQRRINILESKLPATTTPIVILSPALVAAAEAQGIPLDLLKQLTPHDQALLEGAFTGHPVTQ